VIISHKHRFIFFAVPKTATHAIRQALRVHLDDGDWEQQVLFGEQYLPIPSLAAMRHGHISVSQLRPHLKDDLWHSYTKFGFVRNPFDRYISTCFFLNRGKSGFESQAVPFMKRALTIQQFRRRILVTPQYRQLSHADGSIGLDIVGRYETLQESYDEICSRIGIPGTDLERKNPSSHASYRSYYDGDLVQQVSDFYKDDFRMFGYSDDLNPTE